MANNKKKRENYFQQNINRYGTFPLSPSLWETPRLEGSELNSCSVKDLPVDYMQVF